MRAGARDARPVIKRQTSPTPRSPALPAPPTPRSPAQSAPPLPLEDYEDEWLMTPDDEYTPVKRISSSKSRVIQIQAALRLNP